MTQELVIEGLSKTYPNGVQALRGITLRIGTGMFGLLGPNGAGKTTLMRIIATLLEPDRGSVRLDGLDVLEEKDAVRRLLGYLPQEFGVYPRMNAERMLHHFAVLKGIQGHGERRDVVQGLLQQTNLWEVRKQKLGTFSGGMKQRFGIAQALLGEPSLMIVDEPTAGLDPAERLRFHNLLSQIGENIVVILSTHIVEDVSDLCGQMAIIAEGRVLLEGEPLATIEELRGKIWSRAVPRGELASYEAEHTVIATRLVGGRTVIHVLADQRPDGFDQAHTDLEDVYFSTLKRASQRAAA
jgi:ABC-type multidrug transport system ATPase subunit